MNIKKIFLISLLTTMFITLPALHAQWMPDEESERLVQNGIDLVYNLYLNSALVVFNQIVETHPSHPSGHFFVAMVDWMKILMDMDDEQYDRIFFDQLENVIKLSDNMLRVNRNDLAALFFKGGAIGFRGRLRAHRGHWVRAANDGRRALPVVRRAERLAPDNADVLLGTGMYNYYAEVIPDMFPWVKPFMIFFPSGHKEEGINQLKNAAEKGRYANIEAAYFLMQIYYFNERRYREGYEIAVKLHEQYPRNAIFHRYLGRFSVSTGRMEEGFNIFNEIIDRHHEGVFGYNASAVREAKYYTAQHLFNNNRMSEAFDRYKAVLEHSELLDDNDDISGWAVLSILRLGMIHDLMGEREKALHRYNEVLNMDNYRGSHSLAERYIENPFRRGTNTDDVSPHQFK